MMQASRPAHQAIPAEVVEVLEDRLATLNFLARVYEGELEPEVLQPLLRQLAQPATPGEPASQGQESLQTFATQALASDIAPVAAELSAEYVAMFFSSWRRGVSPYESVYTSQQHIMLQQATDDLSRLYADEGLQADVQFGEPADHVALELAFMACLCQQSLDAAYQGDWPAAAQAVAKQVRFLDDHLLFWVPAFCRDLAEMTQSDFYRGLAWLTAEFLQTEPETLDDLLRLLQAGPVGEDEMG